MLYTLTDAAKIIIKDKSLPEDKDCIMDSYENLFDVGKFGSKGCLSNAEYMDELTDSYEFKKKIIKHKGKKRRAVEYKK